jgi:hypothetical protein
MTFPIQPFATAHPPGGLPFAGPAPRARWAGVVVAVLLAAACGKKGPPLAPLQRVPAKVGTFAAHRADESVFLTLTVPTANIGGDQPADVAVVEVYALTSTVVPPVLVTGRVPATLTLVSSLPVRRPLPPPPPVKEGMPPVPALPLEPGLDQGAVAAFRETLSPAVTQVLAADAPATPVAAVVPADPAVALSLPVVYAPLTSAVRRHYVAVAVSRQGRRGPWSDWQSVPLGSTSGAPAAPAVAVAATALTVTWTPAPDARVAPLPPVEGALDSRPFGPALAVTRYNIYAADAVAGAAGAATRPAPLNETPLSVPTFSVASVAFGEERCFVVRGLDGLDGVDVEGPVSPPGCVTPRDTFPPPAPTALEAVAGASVISLIWEAVDTPDLAGYLVYRGTASGEPTEALTPAPIGATSFEDRSVTPGVRYVYVVVAVDSATPVNRSAPSNRAEETARQ